MTSPDTAPACDTRLHALRRLALGELADAEAGALRAHVTACPRCTARTAALDTERAHFLAHADVAVASARILEAAEAGHPPSREQRWARWLTPALATFAAAGLAIVLVLPRPVDDGHRLKGGGPALTLYVNRPTGPERVEPGAPLVEGDQIQLRYAAAGHRFIYVVSVDGRQAISSLHPVDPGHSAAAEPGGDRVLPGSVILDDAMGPERIFALFSDEPVAFEAIEPAIRRALDAQGGDVRGLDRIDWPGADQATVWFVKVP